jgi:hypothetical protein
MTHHSCASRDAFHARSGILMVLSFSYCNNPSSAQITARYVCAPIIKSNMSCHEYLREETFHKNELLNNALVYHGGGIVQSRLAREECSVARSDNVSHKKEVGIKNSDGQSNTRDYIFQ